MYVYFLFWGDLDLMKWGNTEFSESSAPSNRPWHFPQVAHSLSQLTAPAANTLKAKVAL